MSQGPYEHSDVRWNPDLQEWFCARCGTASDHALKEHATAELSVVECDLFGVKAEHMSDRERDLRAYHLTKRLNDSHKKSSE